MGEPGTTCWTVIEGAADGKEADREAFAKRYIPVVRAYLCARWRASPLIQSVDDVLQDVFVDCFREGGALGRADRERGAFLPFFYGVVRNVARRAEEKWSRTRERQADTDSLLEKFRSREESLSSVFDRAWALALLHQAADLHAKRAREAGPEHERRRQLLRLRFEERLPIREIAARWEEEPARLHKEYARARKEFKDALFEVVAFHLPGPPAQVHRECVRLLSHFQ